LIKDELNIFLTALQFLTRLPISGWVRYNPEHLNQSTKYFPLVGLVVAAIGTTFYLVSTILFSEHLSVLIAILATVLVTGAFHEDGLADSCDGFGGSYDREKIMTIIKDSRLGTFGALGLWFLMTFKFLTLVELSAINNLMFMKAFAAGHVLSRYSSLVLILRYPYVSQSSKNSKPIAESLSQRNFLFASTVALVMAFLLLQEMLLLPLSLAAVVTWRAGRYFSKRIGGITGDTLGAANQLVELSIYLGVQLQIHLFLVGSATWKFF